MTKLALGHQQQIPWKARADGFVRRLYRCHFNNFNNFDLTNDDSPDPTKEWFCKHRWPNYGSGDPTREWRTFNPQDPIELSISNEGLLPNSTFLSGFVPIDSNISIISAAASVSDPRGYVGNAFGPGGYFRSRSRTYNGNPYQTTTVAADWMMPLPVLLGQVKKYVEIDTRENFGFNACHNALIVSDESDPLKANAVYNTVELTNYPNDDAAFHYFDVSWKRMSQNGGVGLFTFLRDDVVNNTFSYIASDAMAECDVMKYVMFYSGHVFGVDLFEYYGTAGQTL